MPPLVSRRFRVFVWTLLVVAFAASFGCRSKYVDVGGRVTFADGTPLKNGTVIFSDGYSMARGDLGKNGEYSLHRFRLGDGIRRGFYEVYVVGAITFEPLDDEELERQKAEPLGVGKLAESRFLIDLQFMNPRTSGWKFDVQESSTFDLVVYPPDEVPDDVRTDEAREWLGLDEE